MTLKTNYRGRKAWWMGPEWDRAFVFRIFVVARPQAAWIGAFKAFLKRAAMCPPHCIVIYR